MMGTNIDRDRRHVMQLAQQLLPVLHERVVRLVVPEPPPNRLVCSQRLGQIDLDRNLGRCGC